MSGCKGEITLFFLVTKVLRGSSSCPRLTLFLLVVADSPLGGGMLKLAVSVRTASGSGERANLGLLDFVETADFGVTEETKRLLCNIYIVITLFQSTAFAFR